VHGDLIPQVHVDFEQRVDFARGQVPEAARRLGLTRKALYVNG
jgi:hypothetical protein